MKGFTGRIKKPGVDIDLKKIFMEEGFFSIRVTSLGPNLFIMEDLVEGEVEVFIEEKREWWEQWFSCIKPWDPNDIDEERFAWIRILGVPCHAWGERLFVLIAESFGYYVKSDEETILKSRLDEARVCIRTKTRNKVEETLSILIEGILFSVSIIEDGTIQHGKHICSRLTDESESEMTSSSEEFNSDGEEYNNGKVEIVERGTADIDDVPKRKSQLVEEEIEDSLIPSPNREAIQLLAQKETVVFIENSLREGNEAHVAATFNE